MVCSGSAFRHWATTRRRKNDEPSDDRQLYRRHADHHRYRHALQQRHRLPPWGSFHLLGQQWFQYTLGIGSAAGGGTGTITGAYSLDKGVTWRDFYVATVADGLAAAPSVSEDEVYVGMFKDIRFQYLNAAEAPTVFEVQMALNCHKATSKVTPSDVLVNSGLALT